MIRCKWCNLNNPIYIQYHDNEWCKPNFDDKYLYEMLILEAFQAGLSWECVLNKREDFRKAFDNFDIDKISNYKDDKIQELLNNKKIIRNKLKIYATINNSIIFKKIQNEYGTFYGYLKTFTNGKIIYEIGKTTNQISDIISKDLQKRGMKFVGSTIIYSYLQAIGMIYSHDKECFMYNKKIGFTIGKFAPLHKGHQLLIETALKEMDEVYVVIYDTNIIDIDIEQRANWIKQLYPDVHIIYAYNSPQKYGLDDESVKIQMEYLSKLIKDIPVTHFYSSELYGEKVANYLNIENRIVDLERKKVPVSATILREGYEENSKYIEGFIYSELNKKSN